MLPGDFSHTAECCSHRQRQRKWAGVRFLHSVVTQLPYRYHSMACALEATPGGAYTVSQATFVARMMAEYNFNCKLRMDTQLRSLYECFEGARTGEVDYRDILCCMTVLRRFREVRDAPFLLFRDLVLLYSEDGAGTVVCRQDALRLARMGGLHGGDVMQTSTRLNKYLMEEAGSRGLKPTFRYLNVAFLLEVIEGYPSVLVAIRTQLWRRVPEAWRLGVLQAIEAIGIDKAGSGALAREQRRAARWYSKTLSRRVMVEWKVFRNQAKLKRAQRAAVVVVVFRHAIRHWRATTAKQLVGRKHCTVAIKRGRILTLRRFFSRIVDHTKMRKAMAAMTWAFSKQGKLVVAGVALLRGVHRTRSMRFALRAWCETASLMNAWEFSVDLSRKRLCRKAFAGFRETVRTIVAARRAEDEADARAAALLEVMEEAEREKELLAVVAEAKMKREKAEAKVVLMRQRAAAHQARIEAARAESVARDAEILARQRETRRRRVYEDRAHLQEEFDATWEVKLREMATAEMEAAREWVETDKEAIFKVQKEMHILKRKVYASPSPQTTDMERALRDPANAIFAHMANLLYQENKALDTFFHQFDKEGDGYLAHEEFKGMVSSLNIKLSGEQIRSVVRAIDLDGGGFIDFPEFEAAVKRHEDVCGEAGSPWKMYVSPVHAVMVLHNVETNEEIWDYKATDIDLKRVVKDNIVGLEGIAAKKKATADREKAWESLLKGRAATTMQRQYHAWAARKRRALLRWKQDLEKGKEDKRTDAHGATQIQCWWRGLRAKWLALRLLQITVEVLFDPGTNQRYYFNHGFGQAFWEVPSMLKRWRGRDSRMPGVPEWVLISRAFGQSYFYNTRSRLLQDEKPAGCMWCVSCTALLATRRCIVEERELCFVCYRREHLVSDEGCWHEWEASKTYTCSICRQRDATTVCPDCGKGSSKGEENAAGGGGVILCHNCWNRTHAYPDARHHQGITLELWLARKSRGGGEGGESSMLGGGVSQDSGGVGLLERAEWGVERGSDVVEYFGAEQFGHDLTY